MIFNKKIFIFPILLLICSFLFSQNNSSASSSASSDKTKNNEKENNNVKTQDDDDWLNSYINIDPSDDLLHDFKLKHYKISKDYVENLIWNQEIKTYIDDIDAYNLRKNINILPRFPFIFMLFGGFENNRGFDPGFLFRADNLFNSRLALTLGNSYVQNGKFWSFANIEYPAFLDNRLKVFGTFGYYTTYPEASSYVDSMIGTDMYRSGGTDENPAYSSNFFNKVFNKIWKTLDVTFYSQDENGIDAIGGFDYRIPFVELNSATSVKYSFKYDSWRMVDIHKSSYLYGNNPGENLIKNGGYREDFEDINIANIGLNIKEELRWDKLKQTATIATGNYLVYSTELYLPTSYYLPPAFQEPNSQIRVKNRIEEKFVKKVLREFSVRFRLLVDINYNLSEDFSGDPYVRGLASQELTGWFACLSNLEIYIPIVNIDMKAAANFPFNRDAKFLIYLALFADGGFTIENYNYYLENAIERFPSQNIRNMMPATGFDSNKNVYYVYPKQLPYLGSNNYLIPASTLGGGLRIYPYFLPFIIRFDVGFNLLKTITYGDASQSFELIFSFNEMF